MSIRGTYSLCRGRAISSGNPTNAGSRSGCVEITTFAQKRSLILSPAIVSVPRRFEERRALTNAGAIVETSVTIVGANPTGNERSAATVGSVTNNARRQSRVRQQKAYDRLRKLTTDRITRALGLADEDIANLSLSHDGGSTGSFNVSFAAVLELVGADLIWHESETEQAAVAQFVQ
jgi:hypothetical protein